MTAKRRYRKREIIILCTLFISIVVCSGIIFMNFRQIQDAAPDETFPVTKRDYTILITGVSEDNSFLKQVSQGASLVSNFYDCAIMYYEPDAYSKENNMNSLLDYAGFINADCVITYLDRDAAKIEPPRNHDNEVIPLITVGHYLPEVSSTSHIGINYAELGLSMAEEAVKYLNGRGTIYLLNTFDVNDYYTSTVLNNVVNRLNQENEIKVIYFSSSRNTDFSIEDDVRQQMASSGKIDLVMTISEQGTVLAVQTLSDLNLHAKTGLIGFGDGKESLNYIDKGLITKLFTPDAVDIGKKAVGEFFEYRTNGSANNYVTADFMLIEPGIKND